MSEITRVELEELVARLKRGGDTEQDTRAIFPVYISFGGSAVSRLLRRAAETKVFECADGTDLALDMNGDGKVIGIEFV